MMGGEGSRGVRDSLDLLLLHRRFLSAPDGVAPSQAFRLGRLAARAWPAICLPCNMACVHACFFLLACPLPFSAYCFAAPSWIPCSLLRAFAGFHGLAAMAQSLSISHHHHHHHHLAVCPLQTRLTHHHVLSPFITDPFLHVETRRRILTIHNKSSPSETIRPAQNSFQLTERSLDNQLSCPCASSLDFLFLVIFFFLYSPHAFFCLLPIQSPPAPTRGHPPVVVWDSWTLGLWDGLGWDWDVDGVGTWLPLLHQNWSSGPLQNAGFPGSVLAGFPGLGPPTPSVCGRVDMGHLCLLAQA